MANKKAITVGVLLAGGIGYYLYNAGGDPKVAQKQMECMCDLKKQNGLNKGSDITQMMPTAHLPRLRPSCLEKARRHRKR